MSRSLIALAAVVTLAACSPAPARPAGTGPTTPPSAELGTVASAYPPGSEIEPDVAVLASIPVGELTTTEPIPLEPPSMCANVPSNLLTEAGLDPAPVSGDQRDMCGWRGGNLGVQIGVGDTMADQVAEHVDMATGRTTDRLAHLAWLRVGTHYAIERVLEFDRSATCMLTLDLSIPGTVHVQVFPTDPSGDPVEAEPADSVESRCPIARRLAAQLLDHLDDQGKRSITKPARPTE